jgi:hypothetical protein
MGSTPWAYSGVPLLSLIHLPLQGFGRGPRSQLVNLFPSFVAAVGTTSKVWCVHAQSLPPYRPPRSFLRHSLMHRRSVFFI